tara:strand:+ start:43706 stop:43948 length:243 start_codon:yes stop_codon:yes gene_type:complete
MEPLTPEIWENAGTFQDCELWLVCELSNPGEAYRSCFLINGNPPRSSICLDLRIPERFYEDLPVQTCNDLWTFGFLNLHE